jgi:hypothetical protein
MVESILRDNIRVYTAESISSCAIRSIVESLLRSILWNVLGDIPGNILREYLDAS